MLFMLDCETMELSILVDHSLSLLPRKTTRHQMIFNMHYVGLKRGFEY